MAEKDFHCFATKAVIKITIKSNPNVGFFNFDFVPYVL